MTRKERILARLQELGAGPKRSLGQNFLVSDIVIERILAAAKSEPCSEMIEVGPGLGALTEDLIEVARSQRAKLTLLELDRAFAESWRRRVGEQTSTVESGDQSVAEGFGHQNLPEGPGLHRVVEGDALQLDWRELGLASHTLFVSNLPYQISSSLVIERSIEPAGVTRMILMFQKEVAQRIAARARTEDYGLLTVIAQTFWETSTVCDAGPKDFFPPPNVASRVLSFRRRKDDPFASAPVSGATPKGYLKFVKAAFSHRRKLLVRNLIGEYFGGDKTWLSTLESLLIEAGHKATARAEELDPREFVRLYLAVLRSSEQVRLARQERGE